MGQICTENRDRHTDIATTRLNQPSGQFSDKVKHSFYDKFENSFGFDSFVWFTIYNRL